MFIDEFSIERIRDKDKHNFISYKGGVRLGNWPFQNIIITTEYTFTLPMTYQHFVSTTSFESNQYNLGHYMRDNSSDLFISVQYKPIRGLMFDLFYNLAEHGNNYVYGEYEPGDEAPVMQNITWRNNVYGLNAKYELVNNAYLFLKIAISDIQGFNVDGITAEEYLHEFTPEFLHGKTNTISIGANVGF